MTDERISDERLAELAARPEVGGLHPYAKQLDEQTLVAKELLALRASHAELVKELEDHMWQPSHPASLFLLCRGCSSPQGKAHHKVCCINNALENARKVMG